MFSTGGGAHSHSHPQFEGSLSPRPCQHLLFVVFPVVAILTAARRSPAGVRICISLAVSDAAHRSVCSWATYRSSSEKCLFRSSAWF